METGLIDQAYKFNLSKLNDVTNLTTKTIDTLLTQADEGMLKNVKTREQLDDLHKIIEDVLTAKLRKKFNI